MALTLKEKMSARLKELKDERKNVKRTKEQDFLDRYFKDDIIDAFNNDEIGVKVKKVEEINQTIQENINELDEDDKDIVITINHFNGFLKKHDLVKPKAKK